MVTEIQGLGLSLVAIGVFLMLALSMNMYVGPTAHLTIGGPLLLTGVLAFAPNGMFAQSKTGLFIMWVIIQASFLIGPEFGTRESRIHRALVLAIRIGNPQCRVHVLSKGNVFLVERASGATAGEFENSQVASALRMGIFKLIASGIRARMLRRKGALTGVWSPMPPV
jgi:hypothetical protein